MKLISELNLTNFEFWSGATQHEFTHSELKQLEHILEELYPEGCTDTQINDLLWFEEQFLCVCIGLNYNQYLNR